MANPSQITTTHHNPYTNQTMKKQDQTIFGIHAILETIHAAEHPISKLWIKNNVTHEALKELLHLAKVQNIPCSRVPLAKLNRLTKKNHQGAIALCSPIPFMDLDCIIQTTYEKGKSPRILFLDSVQDVHNLGAIARTAIATQVDALVIGTQHSAPISGDAVKASAGALAHLPVCRVHDFAAALQLAQNSGLQLVACTEKARQSLYETNLSGPIALILGGEGKGIATEHLKKSKTHLHIPMVGPIASLNVSVAAAVLLYEIVRQNPQ